jgi:hypothetical protein
LQQAGCKIGDPSHSLHPSDDERRFIETKLALAAGLRQGRETLELTQAGVAECIDFESIMRCQDGSRRLNGEPDLLLRRCFGSGPTGVTVRDFSVKTGRTRLADAAT